MTRRVLKAKVSGEQVHRRPKLGWMDRLKVAIDGGSSTTM